MEVAPGLHRLEMPLGNRVLYQHLFIGDRVVVIDTGIRETPETVIFPYLESLGRDPAHIDLVLISHADADHFGGNEAIRRKAPGAWIAAHRLDARWISDPAVIMEERYNQFSATHGMAYPDPVKTFLRNMMGAPVPVDLQLEGGETILVAPDRPLRILHLPGHTRGHIGIYDPVHGSAVLTDSALWKGLPDREGNIVMPPTYCHTETYRTTIRQVMNLELETLCLSHYPLMRGKNDIADFLAETRRFAEQAEETVFSGLKKTGVWKSLKEIITDADPVLGPFGDAKDELAYPLLGHLTELADEGRIERALHDDITHWRYAR
ncbi:MAG: MBL fold metallo-hydrolase [candidate division Zixibacteria bacterium]|nr:MBL fold metallo-hydrolase [candidate division Zixibacteria bacterium]